MPQRKHVHDQGGSTQKAKRARELARSEVPADVAVVDVVVPQRKRRRNNVGEVDLSLIHI